MKKAVFPAVLGLLLAAVAAFAADRESEVAYVEEILVMPDGSRQVRRYPGQAAERPEVTMTPPPAQPRQRGLNTVEKLELDRLEEDFAHGRITQAEYVHRKREIYRSTFMDGDPEDFGAFNQRRVF